MNLRKQFEKETGITLPNLNGMPSVKAYIQWLEEKADNDWQEYHEPLARIYREVGRSLSEAEDSYGGYEKDGAQLTLTKREYIIWWLQSCNKESSTEIENLLSKMIAEHELKMIEQ